MLVIQGQNDPRVPFTEAEQMVAKIRANGGEVWYLVGLNEGHGFAKRDNIDYYQWAVAMFLEKLRSRNRRLEQGDAPLKGSVPLG